MFKRLTFNILIKILKRRQFGKSIFVVKGTMIFMDIRKINHILILDNSISEVINNSTNLNYQNLYIK